MALLYLRSLSIRVFPSFRRRATITSVLQTGPSDMENALGTAPARTPASPAKKTAARVALVDLKESSRFLLNECFRQFGIETVLVSSSAAERLRQEKFEACVLPLAPGAEAVMEAAGLCCMAWAGARRRPCVIRSMGSMQCSRNRWSVRRR